LFPTPGSILLKSSVDYSTSTLKALYTGERNGPVVSDDTGFSQRDALKNDKSAIVYFHSY